MIQLAHLKIRARLLYRVPCSFQLLLIHYSRHQSGWNGDELILAEAATPGKSKPAEDASVAGQIRSDARQASSVLQE